MALGQAHRFGLVGGGGGLTNKKISYGASYKPFICAEKILSCSEIC